MNVCYTYTYSEPVAQPPASQGKDRSRYPPRRRSGRPPAGSPPTRRERGPPLLARAQLPASTPPAARGCPPESGKSATRKNLPGKDYRLNILYAVSVTRYLSSSFFIVFIPSGRHFRHFRLTPL